MAYNYYIPATTHSLGGCNTPRHGGKPVKYRTITLPKQHITIIKREQPSVTSFGEKTEIAEQNGTRRWLASA
jgi:hypothetical protein